jgi:hypothetical protein
MREERDQIMQELNTWRSHISDAALMTYVSHDTKDLDHLILPPGTAAVSKEVIICL